ncbi:MAG: 5'-methylthioadenosine/adenosylhomocysteine nucleosidase [Acidobacteriota bacterium]|nr:5'-methylthioadenosine/adenosylhomocysteine nucleosidase [Acidobacteriota bacterium]
MTGTIGIIGAMEVEVEQLVGLLEDGHATTVSGMTFHEGTLGETQVVIVRCGVGKVSAAMCAQTLIDRFGAEQVINTGVAGSLDASLDIGDLVVSTDAVQHDMDVTGLGYPPGHVPELDKLEFDASDELRAVVCKAAAEVAPDTTVVEGRVASGDQFVITQGQRDFIISTFGASCCEMEGAAIAHVCHRNDVPFVIVRAISDKADGTSVVEYRVFEREAAHHCAAIVRRAVELLA